MILLRSDKYRAVILEDIQEKIQETSRIRDQLRMALDENKVRWELFLNSPGPRIIYKKSPDLDLPEFNCIYPPCIYICEGEPGIIAHLP